MACILYVSFSQSANADPLKLHILMVDIKVNLTCNCCLAVAAWNNYRHTGILNNGGVRAVRTTFAGFILLAISNALLILSMGTEPHVRDTYNNPVATTGPAGVQSTRTLGAGAAPLEGGHGQTVV